MKNRKPDHSRHPGEKRSITRLTLLLQRCPGDPRTVNRVITLTWPAIYRRARSALSRSAVSCTATELANTAYVGLFRPGYRFENRRHFYGSAFKAIGRRMGGLAEKRAKRPPHVPFEEDFMARSHDRDRTLRIDVERALKDLEKRKPRAAAVARLLAAGLSQRAIARQFGVAPGTVRAEVKVIRNWFCARGLRWNTI